MSSRTERACGPRPAFSLLCCAALLGVACGDDAEPEAKSSRSVADALTRGVRFSNGTVRLGDIGDSSSDRVRLVDADERMTLQPGQSMLLSLGVESSEQDAALDAVLLQFSGGDSHIEVREDSELGENFMLSLGFAVDEDVCEGLCAQRFELTMVQAVRTDDDEISDKVERVVVLDCRAAGDPDLCREPQDAAMPEPPARDASTAMDAAPQAADITELAAALSDGLSAAHNALCTSCSDPERVPCYAIVPLGAIACIEGALTEAEGTPELADALQALVADVEGVEADCAACDLEACTPSLLDDAIANLPADAGDAVAECTSR